MNLQDIINSPLFIFLPIGLIFYFLVMRPQQKRASEHRKAIENLRRGDTVVTAGGLIGRVTKAPVKEDAEVTIEIADNVQVKVVKGTLTEIRAKTQPVDGKSDKS
ncbi:MAG TPA: preprotein translocase subunit YajC [Rhizomicrobium sp.]|jgi:preprotein translocase subunit YajC|nr:preprotein translocase subunit YajC [Rhizomicrobium sp.]